MTLEPIDFKNIVGNEHAKRALEVASAGRHSVLVYGCVGSGKTTLARGLLSIAVSQAPWEDKSVKFHIYENRIPPKSAFENNDHVVITMRTCLCSKPKGICQCSTSVIRKLHEKILYALNFVDITIPVYPEELWKQPGGKREDSATVFERVKRCVNFLSKDRNSNEFPGKLGIFSLDSLRKKMNKSAEELLNAWEKKENPEINGVLRALRVALTIAFMDGSDYITAPHIAEAVQYRMVRFDLV